MFFLDFEILRRMQIRVFDIYIQEKEKLYAPKVIGPKITYQFILILDRFIAISHYFWFLDSVISNCIFMKVAKLYL
jgi:hypothetical protein